MQNLANNHSPQSYRRILGIESSCDETAVAIYDEKQGLMSHCLHSQIDLHQQYGGVVPEIAARDHLRVILPLVKKALSDACCSPEDIDAIAYTQGPGLIGALLIGASTAKSLGLAWNKPCIGIHHMEGHCLAPLLDESQEITYPFIALLASGGHTQLYNVQSMGQYTLLGETLDDAVGEAFDKTAKLMGLPYPGGPELEKLAQTGDAFRYVFPKPLKHKKTLDFSFSGLKTHALTLIQQASQEDYPDIAASFQHRLVDCLTQRCLQAAQQTGVTRIVVAGGVSANSLLRQALDDIAQSSQLKIHYPPMAFCTDNAAMIAYAGAARLRHGYPTDDDWQINVMPRCPLSET